MLGGREKGPGAWKRPVLTLKKEHVSESPVGVQCILDVSAVVPKENNTIKNKRQWTWWLRNGSGGWKDQGQGISSIR